jgi:putative transcriptional regulator
MSEAFESIRQGLQEAIAHAKGEPVVARVHTLRPLDIKALRQSLGLTQAQFAARLGFSVATLRHWERGDRTPKGPALVLLTSYSASRRPCCGRWPPERLPRRGRRGERPGTLPAGRGLLCKGARRSTTHDPRFFDTGRSGCRAEG